MRKLFIGAALFLGFSGLSFSQTAAGTVIMQQQVEIQNGEEIVMKNGMKAIIENPSVTIYPGELVILQRDSLERVIAVKGNGQVIGRVKTIALKEDVDSNLK